METMPKLDFKNDTSAPHQMWWFGGAKPVAILKQMTKQWKNQPDRQI